jgi:hypothetical protein
MKTFLRTIKIFGILIGCSILFTAVMVILTHYTVDRLSDNGKIIAVSSVLLGILIFVSYKIAKSENP